MHLYAASGTIHIQLSLLEFSVLLTCVLYNCCVPLFIRQTIARIEDAVRDPLPAAQQQTAASAPVANARPETWSMRLAAGLWSAVRLPVVLPARWTWRAARFLAWRAWRIHCRVCWAVNGSAKFVWMFARGELKQVYYRAKYLASRVSVMDVLFYVYLAAITAASGIYGFLLSSLAIGVKAVCDFYRPRNQHFMSPHPILRQSLRDRFRQSVQASFVPGSYPRTPQFRQSTAPAPFVFASPTSVTTHKRPASLRKQPHPTLKKLHPRVVDLTEAVAAASSSSPSLNLKPAVSAEAPSPLIRTRPPVFSSPISGSSRAESMPSFVGGGAAPPAQAPVAHAPSATGILTTQPAAQQPEEDLYTQHDHTLLVEELDSPRAPALAPSSLANNARNVRPSVVLPSRIRKPTPSTLVADGNTLAPAPTSAAGPTAPPAVPVSQWRRSTRQPHVFTVSPGGARGRGFVRRDITRFKKPLAPRRNVHAEQTATGNAFAPLPAGPTSAPAASSAQPPPSNVFKFDDSEELATAPKLDNAAKNLQPSVAPAATATLVPTHSQPSLVTLSTEETPLQLQQPPKDPFGSLFNGTPFANFGGFGMPATAVESDPNSPFETQP